jgi:probable F420-dependent oxidoreductase
VRIGIHLPQYGRAAGPQAIRDAARHAEALGFADVWVSDHTVQPAAQDYPSPYLYDPLITLTWAAAATERIGLGTSVLVVPMHEPVGLANALASLDNLSGGRLRLAVGVGWSEAEYAAVGADFSARGKRMDEALQLFRLLWRDDPVSFQGTFRQLHDIRLLPKPIGPIPIWGGGSSEAAFERAVTLCDGFQFIGLKPDTVAPLAQRLRERRPGADFEISLRTGWDPLGMDPEVIRAEWAAFRDAGIQHVVSAPWQRSGVEWLESMSALAALIL